MRGLDGIKNSSPLGVEPKGEGIQGTSGFSTGEGGAGAAQPKPADKQQPPASAPKTSIPTAPASAPAIITPTSTVSKLAPVLAEDAPPLPVLKAKAQLVPNP
jgi:hypothetical protein